MAKTPRTTPSTRDHILDTARRLLNDHGVDRVTTRMIADAAGINEGNLYYHFRTKAALHLALVDRMEAAAVALLSEPRDYRSMTFFDGLLHDLFVLAQGYRFLVTDLSPVRDSPKLRARVTRFGVNVQAAIELAVAEMQRHRVIALTGTQRDRLIANSWIVGTYWAHYLALHHGVRRPADRHLRWAVEQVRSLYDPYVLIPAAAD